MKRITTLAIAAAMSIVATTSCSADFLETAPTTAVSGQVLFENTSSALTALNGIYSAMHKSRWSVTGNYAMSQAYYGQIICSEVMGDDMIVSEKGSNWFWVDHIYGLKEKWNTTTWREYDVWNQCYTYIANANYIIAAKDKISGVPSDINYIVGQAYALRGYSYYLLSLWFSRTYKGHESEKCVPIYLEPSVAGTQGKARSSVSDVYSVITSDLDTAINRLKNSYAHTSKVHLDYWSVNGLRARVALTMEDWQKAADCANIARSNTSIGEGKDLTSGMNSLDSKNVMWGTVFTDADKADSPYFYQEQMFGHFDKNGTHGKKAKKRATPDLIKLMGPKDVRQAWWIPEADSKVDGGFRYQQDKFRFSDISTYSGDIIFMRNEEMLLIEAEALCRLHSDGTAARNLLLDLMKQRDPDYTCSKTGTELGKLTNDKTGSLLEEILNQRRVELWGEAGRIFDIRRLKQGFTRSAGQGFNTLAVTGMIGNTQNPESWAWVLPLPQKEFDGNAALNLATDQNPMNDGV